MSTTGEGAAEEWYVVQRWGVGERWGPGGGVGGGAGDAGGGADEAGDAGGGADEAGDAGGRADEAGDGGAVWIAYPEEGMQRASAALAIDGDVWVVDPVDTADLDDLLGTLGEVRGVVVLLDRHWRDADDVAARHDVPVSVPDWFDGVPALDADLQRFGDRLPDTDFRARRVVDNRFWQEAALFDGETLVVPEAVGTAEYFTAGDERLGVHPVLRVRPPRGPLGGLGPERIVVGHGEGLAEDATPALAAALSNARRGAPAAVTKMLSGILRS